MDDAKSALARGVLVLVSARLPMTQKTNPKGMGSPEMLATELGADMRRREFISLFGGATAVWPLAARAQRPAKLAVY